MIDFGKIRESITALVNKEGATTDDLKALASVTAMIDTAEKEHKEVVDDSNELRKMYIEACKQVGTNKAPEQASEQKEVSFEDMLMKKALEENSKR